jgi:hypothetical protein
VAWSVKVTEEYGAWFTALIKEDLASATQVAQAVAALREEGPALGRPLMDRVQGSRIHHLKELPGGHERGDGGRSQHALGHLPVIAGHPAGRCGAVDRQRRLVEGGLGDGDRTSAAWRAMMAPELRPKMLWAPVAWASAAMSSPSAARPVVAARRLAQTPAPAVGRTAFLCACRIFSADMLSPLRVIARVLAGQPQGLAPAAAAAEAAASW